LRVAPICEEALRTILHNGDCVVEITHLVDHIAFHDQEDRKTLAVPECGASGACREYARGDAVHLFRANEASKFVRKQIKDENDQWTWRFAIHGNSNASVENSVRIALDAAGFGLCDVTFSEYSHHIGDLPQTDHQTLIGDPEVDVTAMINH
jgi:hypothetical protein